MTSRPFPLPTLALLLALSACVPPDAAPPFAGAVRYGAADPPALAFTAADAPAVLDVVTQRPGPRAFIQRIVLENRTSLPGENRIDVRIDLRLDTLSDALGLEPRDSVAERLDAATVQAVLEREFPGAAMVLSDRVPANRHGPYMYAEGRGPRGAACLFAWQLAAGPESGLPGGVYRMAVQFRFCDPARSPADLRALFETLALRPPYGRDGTSRSW